MRNKGQKLFSEEDVCVSIDRRFEEVVKEKISRLKAECRSTEDIKATLLNNLKVS